MKTQKNIVTSSFLVAPEQLKAFADNFCNVWEDGNEKRKVRGEL